MLMVQPSHSPPSRPQREWSDQPGGAFDLANIVALIRRQFWIFVSITILSIAAGIAYIFLADPQYTATSSILINTRATRAVEGTSGPSVFPADKNDPYVDNQAEVIKSDSISLAVVRKLDLTKDPLFTQDTLLGSVTKAVIVVVDNWLDLPAPGPLSDGDMQEIAVMHLQKGLDVRRVMNTSVIDVSFTSVDPTLAARIASAYADAYLEDQFATRQDISVKARSWLESRIQELSRKSLAADLAIQRFRAENNLVTAGGKLITDQQLSELNTQLTLARAESARTEARYLRIQSILELGRTDAMMGTALDDPVVNSLRSKYLDASKRESELSARLGPEHIQAVNLREEMRQYEKLILGELKRIGDSYRNDYEVAKAKEQSLKDGLAGLAGVSAAESDLTPKLRELEREAETLRTLHKDLLQRFQEANQLESFPIADARIITDASPPLLPSYPRKALTLAISLVGGAMLGAGIGLMRDLADQSLRTGGQVRNEIGVEFLGNLPNVTPAASPHSSPTSNELAERREFSPPPIMRYVVQAPLSRYTETLRGVKVATDFYLQDEAAKVVGITSILTDEGKSTTAKNFASLLALQGARTLLIDADLRNPGLTSAIAPWIEIGLVQALVEQAHPDDLILREPDTGLFFLPVAGRSLNLDTSNLLTSPRMRELMNWAKERFDYVVIDLPPIRPIVDVRAFAPQLSALLIVAEWGRTSARVIREVVLADSIIRDACLGVILNRVNTRILPKYDSLGTRKDEEKFDRNYYCQM
ncbi:Wzz/FepE/Etk N-terminal domain-containing protein [Microvirga sp. G4-2]|uniref:Wzz/FepE/Etk N-terminal domain-containing protein n=1 Tax=Microvirga sp. G4-2 TaxID=3434467 RepID=UPI0040447A66